MTRLEAAGPLADRTVSQLRRLFRPRHIALVGASETSRFMRQLVSCNEELGYQGEISLVNPRHEMVFGRPSRPSLSDLPEVPDTVIISIPAPAVPFVVHEGLRLGVRSFVVHTSGFAERGPSGAAAQEDLREACHAADAVLIGPNCMGALSLTDRVAVGGMPLPLDIAPGRVGIIAQSGSAATTLMNSGRGLRFSYVVSSGNEAVTTAEDLLAFFIEDPSTSLILAFIEGFRRPRRLIELGRQAMAAGKPVIVLKTGMTQRSSQIARSHSGALAGSAEAHIAALDEAGIIRVDDFDEMVETAVLLSHVTERPASARTAIFTNSGGETGLTADVAAATGLDIASYSPATTERLQQVLELAGDVLPTNPLDSGMGFASSAPFRDRLRTALQLYDADPGVDVIVFGIDLNKRTSPAAGASDGLEVVRQEALRGRKVFTVLSHLTSGGVDDEVAAGVRSAGVPVLLGTRQGLLAIRHLGEYGQSRLMPSPGSGANPERAGAFIPAVPAGAVLGELALAPLLREYGIPQAAASLATSAEQAVAIAGQIGYPVVLKIVSADVVHKSRAGGVRVGLTSEAAVAESFQSIIDAISASSPQARLNGVLVARQYPPGPEFLLGARADRDFGPVIIFGRGGTQVEELRTFSVAMAPLTEDRVYRLYQQVATGKAAHSSPDSDGQFRDLLPILVRFGQLAADSESLYDELEINPLLVAATGPIALDARMVLSAGAGERDAGGEGLRD